MMTVPVMIILGNQMPERITPWWARPFIHQRRSRSLARLGGQRSLLILLMGSRFGSEATNSWAYGPTVSKK
jgi:hypothetical protein